MIAGLIRRIGIFALVGLALSSPTGAALVTLTGKVTDQNGTGIFNVTVGLVDSCTGATAPATGNVTSSTGDFRATLNAGVYDLEFSPPAGSLYYAWRIRNFDLTTSKTLTPVKLGFGVVVSGRVQDAAGLGVGDIYARFFPPGTSERTFTVRDKTDASGNFSIVVPAGTYDVKYGPPLGTRFLGLVRPSVPIPGNTSLPTVTLQSDLLASGTVTDATPQAHPVVNANIDATDATTGVKLFVSHDRTDATGAFTLAVPPGTYVFGLKPEKCNLLVGQESAATVISADTALPRVSLPAGVLVKGTVTDTRGAPVVDVNTSYISLNTGLRVFTFEDHTDASGNYSAVIPGQDTYDINYAPNRGVRLAGFKMTNVAINSNGTQVLPTVQLKDAMLLSGRTVTYRGTPLSGIDLDVFPAGATTKIYTPNDLSDAAGTFVVAVEPGTYDVRFQPPSTTTLAARRTRGVGVSADLTLGDVPILEGLPVTGNASYIDPAFGTVPVDNLDMDFFNAYTGEKAETLHDNTDCAGNYGVLVPAGIYNVVFVPPSCNASSSCAVPAPCSLETARMLDVVITSPRGGLNAVLGSAKLVSGNVASASGQPVPNVDLDFYLAGTSTRQVVSRDNTDSQGLFGVFAPPGTYDILFTPPAAAGLAPQRVGNVNVGADVDLGSVTLGTALAPSVGSITPATGPGSGGTAVTIQGANLQEGLSATLGGLALFNIQVLGAGQCTATAPAYPTGSQNALVDLVVTNEGSPAGALLPQSFTYTPATSSTIVPTLTQSVPNVVLSWPSTGQAFYTVFRSHTPRIFGQAQILAIIPAAGGSPQTFTDYGAAVDGGTYYYRVE
jgi:hypothetical protein